MTNRRKKTLADKATDFDWPIKKSNVRRSRGYGFETWLVDKFNELPDWQARRLGGASTGLPDVIATNNVQSIIYAIEAKSLRGPSVDVPADEIKRCQDIIKFFGQYEFGYTIVATRLGDNGHPVYSYWDIQEPVVTKVRAYRDSISIHYERDDVKGQLIETHQWPMPWQRQRVGPQ